MGEVGAACLVQARQLANARQLWVCRSYQILAKIAAGVPVFRATLEGGSECLKLTTGQDPAMLVFLSLKKSRYD